VSIDVAAANGLVAGLRGFVDAVIDEWNGAALVAQRGLCSTASLRALVDPLETVGRLAGELETRVELAVVYDTGDKGQLPTENRLEYMVSDDTLDAVKAQLGIELAEGVQNLEPGVKVLDRGDVVRFEYFTTLLEKYSADAAVTGAMFNRLGPEGVVQAPIILKHFADGYPGGPGYLSDGDVMWDDKTPINQRISDLQQRFMESFGASLATSTNSDAFRSANPDFAKDLAGAATRTRTGQGWGLSQVLRFGDYEPGFLTTLGTELYDWEKDQFGPVWGPQLSSTVMDWRLGTGDNGAHFDPFVGLFEAMGRTPRASLDFFNPDGGGEQARERAEYFITDRRWKADDFNALGLALDAASTAFHRPGVSVDLQERSAWMASATISYLADRDPGMHDRRIGDAGKDSLAHILASYIVDVDRVANNQDDGDGAGVYQPDYRTAAWLSGLPVGADFSLESLNAVLGEVLTEDSAMRQMAEAAAQWNAHRIGVAVAAWDAGTGTQGTVTGSVQGSGQLMGYLLGNLERGSEAVGKATDERNQQFVDLASSVIGLVPTGGAFTSFLADQALSAGGDALGAGVTGNEAAARDLNETAQERTKLDLQIAVATALADSAHLPEAVRTDDAGKTYPWFAGGSFDEGVLKDPEMRNLFMQWLHDDSGDIAPLLTDASQAYDDGLVRGR
jgi:hypothetical protein